VEELENLLVILDFVDVFPKDLPGLLPKRELDFRTDFKPRTELITRTPYWMSTPEL